MKRENPLVGVGIIVIRDGLVLLGERIGGIGPGTWGMPGGHLNFGETVEECARRELFEETGLELREMAVGPYTNDVYANEEKHYVTLFVLCCNIIGEPQVREPMKCGGWLWFSWSQLPTPLFLPIETLRRSGYTPLC